MGSITDFPQTAAERKPYRKGRHVEAETVYREDKALVLILPVIHIERPVPIEAQNAEVVPPTDAEPMRLLTSDVQPGSTEEETQSTVGPEPVFSSAQLSGEMEARLMGSTSHYGLRLSGSISEFRAAAEFKPQILNKEKLAYRNIQRTMMEFEQARAVLHSSSDGMSPAIPLLRAVYDDLMTALPVIEP